MWRRRVIAYLANDTSYSNDYQGTIRLGIERACKSHDLDLWVYAGGPKWADTDIQDRRYEFIYGQRVDGMVVCAATILVSYPLADFIAELRRLYTVPIVSVGQRLEGTASVVVDNARGSSRLADHLVSVHGHRKLVYIAGPRGHQESDRRLQATIGALSRHGITLTFENVRYGDFSLPSGRAATKDLLRNQYGFDAIIAANDLMAVGALEILHEEGLHCPDQVAVVGFDDTPSGRLSQPPLTTARQPLQSMGTVAINHIMDVWRGGPAVAEPMLDADLVIRESCGCQVAVVSPTDTKKGNDTTKISENEIEQALVGFMDDAHERQLWALKLMHAIGHEQAGVTGSLVRTFDGLVDESLGADLSIYDFQRVFSAILAAASQHPERSRVEAALRAAGNVVAMHAYRRPAERHLRSEFLLDDLCASWDVLSTALSVSELKPALIALILRVSVRDALIACHPPGDGEHLVPFVCLRDGAVVELPETPYPAGLLMPEDLFVGGRRRSLTVMPLKYRTERLGVAVFDFPQQLDLYRILCALISSALKVVRLHQ